MAIKELFFDGKTIDIAVDNAAAELGEDRDLLSYELVQAPQKGIFGIGATLARIKVEVEVPDEEITPVTPAPEKIKNFEPEKISKKEKKAPEKSETKPEPAPVSLEMVLSPVADDDEDAKKIEQFLLGLLDKLEITDGKVTVSLNQDGDYFANVEGSKMGVIIGRRGETLDAVNYLTNLVATRGKDKKVIVDSENYRQKRVDTLVALANKTANKAIKYRKNQSLEPMSAYERRIIHAALTGRENITTFSVGSEPRRKVVVSYKG